MIEVELGEFPLHDAQFGAVQRVALLAMDEVDAQLRVPLHVARRSVLALHDALELDLELPNQVVVELLAQAGRTAIDCGKRGDRRLLNFVDENAPYSGILVINF